jgi:hypothetical protein
LLLPDISDPSLAPKQAQKKHLPKEVLFSFLRMPLHSPFV